MATLAPNGQDPNNPNSSQSNAGGGGTVMGGANAPGVSPGGGSPSAFSGGSNTAARPAGNPGGQPNVNDYLNANQGAGQKLANGITNNVQNQANQVNNQVNTSQGQLNNQYNPLNTTAQGGQASANTSYKDPTALMAAYQAAQAQSSGQQYTGANGQSYTYDPSTSGGAAMWSPATAASNTGTEATPVSFQTAFGTDLTQQQALDAYNAEQRNVAGTSQYQQNQQAIGNYNIAGQQANNAAQTQLGALGQTTSSGANEMGRNQLLQNAVGNPNYNQGQQTLDSLFLQGQGNQLNQNLQGIQKTTANNVNNDNTDYQTKLNTLQGLSGSNVDYAKNLFLNGPGTTAGAPTGTSLNQIGTNVGTEYTNTATNSAKTQSDLATAFQNGTLTPDQLQQLGITPGTHTYGMTNADLMNAGHFTNNPLAAADQGGNAQVATPEEFARYNALNQLAGGPSGALQKSIFGSATTAGGYKPVSFDTNAMNQAIQAQQQAVTGVEFKNAINPMLQAGAGPASGSGMQSSYTNVYAPITQQLQQGMAAGTLTPEQAQQIIQGGVQKLQNQYGTPNSAANPGGWMGAFSPFENYYNNTYMPDSRATLGAAAPNAGNGEAIKGTM